jgi:hypothetical protein
VRSCLAKIRKWSKDISSQHDLSAFYYKVYLIQKHSQKKRYTDLEGKNKTGSVCRWHDQLYRKSERTDNKRHNFLELRSNYNKLVQYKCDIQMPTTFHYTSNVKWNLKEKTHCIAIYIKSPQNEILKHKCNKLCAICMWVKRQNFDERHQRSRQLRRWSTIMDNKTQYCQGVSSSQLVLWTHLIKIRIPGAIL